MIYIIDGYNVMHAMEEGGGIAAEDLEDKRSAFIESLISSSAASGDETLVVFDSHAATQPQKHRIKDTLVTVCFATASESADIIIGKLVQQYLSGSEGRIRVVS